jgi:hypothetical protein
MLLLDYELTYLLSVHDKGVIVPVGLLNLHDQGSLFL